MHPLVSSGKFPLHETHAKVPSMAGAGGHVQGMNRRRIYTSTDWVNCFRLWHDDVTKWKHFPRYWPFVRGIHRSPVNSPHKGQWRGALMFSLICVWTNDWVNNREAGDLRRYRAHYDVIVMVCRLFGVKRLSELISLRYNSKFTHFHLRKAFKMQGIGHFGGASMCRYKGWTEWTQTFAIQIYDHISWYPGKHGRHSNIKLTCINMHYIISSS